MLEAFQEHLENICRNVPDVRKNWRFSSWWMSDGMQRLDTGSVMLLISWAALQKRIAESYARVRRMWRSRKVEIHAVNTLRQ